MSGSELGGAIPKPATETSITLPTVWGFPTYYVGVLRALVASDARQGRSPRRARDRQVRQGVLLGGAVGADLHQARQEAAWFGALDARLAAHAGVDTANGSRPQLEATDRLTESEGHCNGTP